MRHECLPPVARFAFLNPRDQNLIAVVRARWRGLTSGISNEPLQSRGPLRGPTPTYLNSVTSEEIDDLASPLAPSTLPMRFPTLIVGPWTRLPKPTPQSGSEFGSKPWFEDVEFGCSQNR